MIIPSIDLNCGRAVQLRQGREQVLVRDHPVALSQEFSRYGEIAVVDLDAAVGNGNNDALIHKICKVGECRVGGGIRSIEKAAKVIAWGADKIIVGTKAFENNAINHDFLRALSSVIGKNRVIIAIDSLYGEIVTEGWRKKTGINFKTIMKKVKSYASELLFTCVEREGMMKGADLEAIERLRASTDLTITAAGGISTLEEIEKLSRLGVNVQLGMALYGGKIRLPDAFTASLKWDNILIPTITVNPTSQVLMLAYSSRESLNKTFETEKVWYYSRSRKKLWMKGETSSNFQNFLKIRSDCDGDAILITVDQRGNACHTGNYSCFGNRVFSLRELYDVIKERLATSSSSSYTSKLTVEMIREKIMEEAQEFIESEKKEEKIWEAADLLYFIIVMLAKNGIPLEEVFNELERRRRDPKKKGFGKGFKGEDHETSQN